MISTYTTTSTLTTTITPTSIITTPVTTTEIMSYSMVVVVALIFLLALKLLISPGAQKNTKISQFNETINIAILPLTAIFLLTIVAYTIVDTLRSLLFMQNTYIITLIAITMTVLACTAISIMKTSKTTPYKAKVVKT